MNPFYEAFKQQSVKRTLNSLLKIYGSPVLATKINELILSGAGK